MRKLAYSAFSISAAFFISEYLLPDGSGPAFAAASLLLILPAIFLKDKKRLAVMIISLSLAFGFVYYELYTDFRFGDFDSLFGEKTITVTVKDFPNEKDYGASVEVEYKTHAGGKLRGVLYMYDDIPENIKPGDKLTLEARISDAGIMRGEETHYYFAKGISFTMSQRGEISVDKTEKIPIASTPLYVSNYIVGAINKVFSGVNSAFASAITLGDTSGLYKYSGIIDDLKLSGIYHIVSVSGMHMAYLVWLCRAVIGRRKTASAAIVVLIIAFAAAVGFKPPVVRAAIMQILIIAAQLFKRESDSITSLSFALCLILLFNPSAAADVGLQLSFAATLGLFTVSNKIYSACDKFFEDSGIYEKTLVKTGVKVSVGSFSASIGASVFTVPLTMIYFGYLSVIAPITNILTFFAMPIIFCGSFICCAIGIVFPTGGVLIAQTIGLLIKFVLFTAKILGRLSFSAIYISNPAVAVWTACVYVICFILVVNKVGATMITGFAALSAAALCIILTATNYFVMNPTTPRLTVFDVGQGAASLITYDGRSILVDCGSTSGEDAGEIVSSYMSAYMCDEIDVIVVTHFHEDHFNGINKVIERVGAKTIIIPEALLSDADAYISLDEKAAEYGSEVITAGENMTVNIGDMRMTVFAPLGLYSENERGLSVLYTYKNYDILITGDMSSEVELLLMKEVNLPDTELLVVGHHGSKYSTGDAFLNDITPEKAIISVGYNTYGHPSDEVLNKLDERGIEVYRTDISGNITIYAE